MHHITFDNCEQKSPHDTKVIHPVYHFHEFNLKIDVKKFEGLLRKASSQKFVVNSSTLETITISVPHHIIWQLWAEIPWRENWTILYTLHIIHPCILFHSSKVHCQDELYLHKGSILTTKGQLISECLLVVTYIFSKKNNEKFDKFLP